MDKIRVGVIGCENIGGAYFTTLKHFAFLDAVACADLDFARARPRCRWGLKKERWTGNVGLVERQRRGDV